MAIAAVHGDSVAFAKGYGVRKVGAGDQVDAHARFAVGSTTKAMTAAALPMLAGLTWLPMRPVLRAQVEKEQPVDLEPAGNERFRSRTAADGQGTVLVFVPDGTGKISAVRLSGTTLFSRVSTAGPAESRNLGSSEKAL